METTIAEGVKALGDELEWTDESVVFGAPDYGWADDDSHGRLVWGPVEVEWTRDPYYDSDEGWVVVNVAVDGFPQETDGCSHLSDAVRDAAHRTEEWQEYRADEIRDEIIEWLDSRCETYDLQGPEDEHDAWTIFWRDVSIQGYFTEDDGTFKWSVSNSETADYLDGDADSTEDDVIEAIETCAADPMMEAWIETIDDLTAEDDWSVRVTDDREAVWMSEPTYTMTRRARYERLGFREGRIEMGYRLRTGEWRAYDEHLPEDEADVHAMAREAYEWVKAVAE